MSPDPHRVVIVGGGFGGLFAARRLRRGPVRVTLVDRDNHHLFQPLLYQVATGILSEGEIAPPIRSVLHRQRNVEVELAEVTGFDLGARTVTARRPDGSPVEIPYDSLIVAAGAGQSYFGHDEFSRWAPGMKTINDALELRGRILGAFEMAELEEDPGKQQEWLTFVVVGGGPTGVEIAGQIAELSRRVLKDDFTRIDPRNARILLFDGGEGVLATFGDRLSGKAAKGLESLGIELQMSSIVTHIDRTCVVVKQGESERRIPARTKVWAAGVEASPLASMLGEATGAEVDRAGRISVLPDCTLAGHPEVFAIGDMMSLDELPGVAEVAMQQGLHASNTIKRRLRGRESQPFRYRDLGSMATISRFRAVVSFKGIRLSGFAGWLVWLFVHLAFLTGFKNRLATIPRWAFTFIGNGRPQRTITMQQVIARVAIEEAGGRPFLLSLTSGEEQPESNDRAARMIGERLIEGLEALTLSSEDGELRAAFVPAAGMVGCSLQHRGEELLGQRGGLRAYVAEHSTMGIPLLHPWANRLSRMRFALNGREIVLDSPGLPVSLDPNGLPIHGLLAGAGDWRVERHEALEAGGLLAASFDFGARPELVAAFPFPHRIEVETTLLGRTLTIDTSVTATGEVAVPVSFGYHPYLRLPGVERSAWDVEIPVSRRIVLDAEELPTGQMEEARIQAGSLGSRTFDDEFAAPGNSAPFVLQGGGRRVEVSLGAGYPYTQIYAPDEDDVIAFEPMTAPTNALVSHGAELPLVAPGETYGATFSITVTG